MATQPRKWKISPYFGPCSVLKWNTSCNFVDPDLDPIFWMVPSGHVDHVLVKIACYWDKTFYNFDMFKNKKNANDREERQEEQRRQV
ncbi:hypothetical protein CK203_097934 [Vitis vinifera]|uniref:Uncharacterized protein n=1 Tax=Vitis vinifera TaxID=29760 RepID=A0A438DQD3_VITVI|nr:hypothetical protein CK203_097934 [Vitis vinifera]